MAQPTRGVWRALAVTASGALFVIAVLQAQHGCDRGDADPAVEPARAPDPAPPAHVPASAPPDAPADAPVDAPSPNPSPPVEESKPKKQKSGLYNLKPPKDDDAARERHFFPASKSGELPFGVPPEPIAPTPQAPEQRAGE